MKWAPPGALFVSASIFWPAGANNKAGPEWHVS